MNSAAVQARFWPPLWRLTIRHLAHGLLRRERIGHTLDTFTELAPILWLVFNVPCERNPIVYIVAGAFSCFFVTRDDVQADLYVQAEHQNHAVLFVAHPLAFAAQAPLWPPYHAPAGAVAWLIWKAPPTEFEARQ